MAILPVSFYENPDVVEVAKQLLGKFLLTKIDGIVTGGMILETEAYRAPEDRASHAYGLKRTKRNEAMYAKGGISYIYLIYGIHYLFNVVTNVAEMPHAVLIRSIDPQIGIEEMLKRRHKQRKERNLTSGPGALCQALAITKALNGSPLSGPPIWIEDRGIVLSNKMITATPRIGIDYAGKDAKLPWRFLMTPSISHK